MQTILITGSNGLIGSNLVKHLKQSTLFRPIGLSRQSSLNCETIELDLSSNWEIEKLPSKVDVIIHLAQSEKFRDFPESALDVFNVNTYSTLKLLDYAKRAGAHKFIYASSGGVYGNSDVGFNEESPLQPNKDLGFYLSTKFSSELLVGNYSTFFDVNILRFFFVYGKKQKKNMLIPRLINSVKSGTVINLQGDDGIKINPIYVDDAANAIIKIISRQGSYNVNIGGSEIVSIKCISEIIGKQFNIKPVFEYQRLDAKNLIGDISVMKTFFTPSFTIEEGIKRMI